MNQQQLEAAIHRWALSEPNHVVGSSSQTLPLEGSPLDGLAVHTGVWVSGISNGRQSMMQTLPACMPHPGADCTCVLLSSHPAECPTTPPWSRSARPT